jgi:hypothetical protein
LARLVAAVHGSTRQGMAGRAVRSFITIQKGNDMKITWAAGSRFKTDAEVAHREVERIRKKCGGEVDAQQLVKAASSKASPLHPEFEWDDKIAASEYRLEQGRLLLRSLVVVRDDVTTDRPQRVYQHVKAAPVGTGDKPRKVYRTIDQVMADPDTRAELLGRALRDLIRIRNQYRDLQELAVVMRGIDTLLETMDA